MNERMQVLDQSELTRIHDATLAVFKETGVRFQDEEAVEIFKRHGVKTDQDVVFIDSKTLESALESAPSQFTLEGREPSKSVTIGGDHMALAPGYGSCHILSASGEMRDPTCEDYDNFCKLVHTSDILNMNGCLMVDPRDIDPLTSHRYMIRSNILLCDKPFFGSSVSREAARDSFHMAGMAWGGSDQLKDKAVMIAIINSLSPLQYSSEMAGAIIEYAKNGQANMLGGMVMAGATGPVQLPGTVVLQNAEFLSGVVLAQLTRPGAPCVYGGTSTITDMRTGLPLVGAPEQMILQNAQAQVAKYYNLPCRGSGGISDGFIPDGQAAMESSMALMNTLRSGSNFIIQSAGILSAYLMMSYEKFIMDEEILARILRMFKPLDFSDEQINLETIRSVGIGNEYLTHPTTFKHFKKEYYVSGLTRRQSHDAWVNSGKKAIHEVATQKVAERIGAYEKPDISPEIEADLNQYAGLEN